MTWGKDYLRLFPGTQLKSVETFVCGARTIFVIFCERHFRVRGGREQGKQRKQRKPGFIYPRGDRSHDVGPGNLSGKVLLVEKGRLG